MKKYLFFLLAIFNLSSLFAEGLLQDSDDSGLYVKRFEYKSLSPLQKKIFDDFITEEFPKGKTVTAILDAHAGSRNKMRLAEALFFRNQEGDIQNAITIIKWIFGLQNLDEKSKDYACWKGSVNDKEYDQNMREFIGTDLIIVYHKYKSILPGDFKKELETALIHAARGDFIRNVNPDYNNISIMSSFMQDYIGSNFNLPEIKAAGIKKAKEIFLNFQKYNTLCEYNSPTYYGVDFTGLALWREMAVAPEFREMGKLIEKKLWLDLSQFYNANLQNICGPYLRSYGIDMKKYTAITGVWITVAVDDSSIAMVPGSNGPHNETNFIVPIFDLGISMPEKALAQFKRFDQPRFLSRITSNYYEGDRLKKITAYIQKEWMMGGLWGNRKVSHILKNGTMHWRSDDGDIGWMYIPGEGKTNVIVDEKQMKIYLADIAARNFELLVYSKNSSVEDLKENSWEFDHMHIGIETNLHRMMAIALNADSVRANIETSIFYPFMYKIVYEIPNNWDLKDPLIVLNPIYN